MLGGGDMLDGGNALDGGSMVYGGDVESGGPPFGNKLRAPHPWHRGLADAPSQRRV